MAEKADPAAILSDIRRVAETLGEPPSTDQYREQGGYSVRTVYNHFEGFVDAREAADVAEGRLPENNRDELLADIQRVADEVDGEPSYQEYQSNGEYAIKGVTYRFGTWLEAKKAAGVYNGGIKSLPSEGEILADMRRVDEDTDGPLSQRRYNNRGEFFSKTAQRVFGSWRAACQISNVEQSNMGPKSATDGAILSDIQRVAKELGHPPSKTEYDEFGDFTYGIIQTRFGRMSDAVEQAGLKPRPEGGQHGELHPLWEGGGERYYGPHWEETKEEIRDRDGECKLCGITEEEHVSEFAESLSVHHIVRFEEFDHYSVANRDENLISLCRSCHSQIDEHDSQTREKLKKLV